MAGAVFTLKALDTRPILEVALKNPDGSAHDLTGSTAYKLHIYVSPSLVLTRDMAKQGLDAAGVLRYTWVTTDWDTGNLPLPGMYQRRQLPMEYEVIGGSTTRMTFPNEGFDYLEIHHGLA